MRAKKEKDYECHYYSIPNECLTNLVSDFMDRYGWIGMTIGSATGLFDYWLESKRKEFHENNSDDDELYKFLFKEQHIILGKILVFMDRENRFDI